jgi:hypothetical protein
MFVDEEIILKWIFKMLFQVVVENFMVQGNEYFWAMALIGSVQVSEYGV